MYVDLLPFIIVPLITGLYLLEVGSNKEQVNPVLKELGRLEKLIEEGQDE